MEQVDCLPVEWVGREVEMKARYGALNSEWLVSLELMQQKKIQAAPMLTKIIPLNEIQEVFQELLDPRSPLVQVVVECNRQRKEETK